MNPMFAITLLVLAAFAVISCVADPLYTFSAKLGGDADIEWSVSSDNKNVSYRVTVANSPQGWVSFGLGTHMGNSRVIIAGTGISGVKSCTLGPGVKKPDLNKCKTLNTNALYYNNGVQVLEMANQTGIEDMNFQLQGADSVVFGYSEVDGFRKHSKAGVAKLNWRTGVISSAKATIALGISTILSIAILARYALNF